MIFLLTFDSTHDALAAQKALAAVEPRVIPVPREITAGCGMAIRIAAENKRAFSEMMKRSTVEEESFVLYQKADSASRWVLSEP